MQEMKDFLRKIFISQRDEIASLLGYWLLIIKFLINSSTFCIHV
jgi:hypothetical protein